MGLTVRNIGSGGSVSAEVKAGNVGTQVLNGGLATAVTAVDLTGVCDSGDIAVLLILSQNDNSTPRICEWWKDAGGTERWARATNVGSAAGDLSAQHQLLLVEVGDPAASLYYSWNTAPVTGASAWVQMCLKGIS